MTSNERACLERKIAALEASNQELRRELLRGASQQGRVASVLAACHRLHSTLDRATMLAALQEALASLIACQEAVVWERLPGTGALAVAACFGAPKTARATLTEAMMEAVQAGRPFVGVHGLATVPARPAVCLPLRADGRLLGVLALYRLAGGRTALTDADWDLLEMLGAHIATALVATRIARRGALVGRRFVVRGRFRRPGSRS